MARNAATAIQNNFVGGFVTQATVLDFPPNAAFDTDNVTFSEIGIAERRFGFDYENNYVTATLTDTEKAQQTYYWKNVGGDGNINLLVQQNGDTLYFYSTASASSLSGGISANTVSLTSFQSSGSTSDNVNQNECQFSTGLGYLFVVHPYCDPFYILYNSDGTFTASSITFTIRDVTGITESGVLVDNRPAALTNNHEYNLLNQGWDTTKIATMHTALSTTYPSNADVWWIFKDSTDVFSPSTTLASNSRGSTPAPKGFFRLNPWSTARQTTANAQQSGVTLTLTGTVDETSGTARPSATEFHAGRVWYTGVNAQLYNTRIYFSAIIQQPSDFGYCASVDDPTSETLFDFLPSDGGIINIPQAGTIYRLVSLGPNLLVFGANGVWVISGSQGIGFSATDYTVSPISDVRSISGSSYVLLQGSVAWWNNTGIWVVTNDPQTGFSVKSMSDDKIKDYFNSLETANKRYARGTYNARTHVLQWLFRSADAGSVSDNYSFDTIILYNTLINAFYIWTIPDTAVDIQGVFTVEGAGSNAGSDTVVDNSANTIVDNSSNTVITYAFAKSSITTTTKYLVFNGTSCTFGEAFNQNYMDWVQAGINQDYTSTFTTGYNVKTQGERKFQSNYLFVFSDLSYEGKSQVNVQSIWDFGNNRNSNRWSNKQLVSHTSTDFDAGRRKLKMRGAGEAVQFKFTSVTGEPFYVVGWSTYDTANQTP